jgi:hypothetical protein
VLPRLRPEAANSEPDGGLIARQAGYHRAVARWVFQGSGDLPRCLRRWWLGNRQWREPASSDRLPIHRSESPTGYSSAGCSPAEPASASPVTDYSSSTPIQRGNQTRCSTSLRGCSPARARRQRECHFYFARRMTFLSCADTPVPPTEIDGGARWCVFGGGATHRPAEGRFPYPRLAGAGRIFDFRDGAMAGRNRPADRSNA